MYTPSDWYWLIGSDDTQVWSSKRYNLVPVGDAEYVAWLALDPGNLPTKVPTMAELEVVLAEQYPPGTLKTYNDDLRYRKETGGLTLSTGMPIKTDDRSKIHINGVRVAILEAPVGATAKWHAADGTIWTLDIAGANLMSNELQIFVNNVYKVSAQVLDDIGTGTITTLAQIDAAYAAVVSTKW